MTDTTLIADLVRAGLSPELLQRVVAEIVEAARKSADSPPTLADPVTERRKAYDRERMAAKRAAERSTVSALIVPTVRRQSADSADSPPTFTPSPLPPCIPLPPAPAPPLPARKGQASEPTLGLAIPENPRPPTKRFAPPTPEAWRAYAATLSPPFPPDEADKALDHYTACGWRIGKAHKPAKDWQACLRTCWRNWQDWQQDKPPNALPQSQPRPTRKTDDLNSLRYR